MKEALGFVDEEKSGRGRSHDNVQNTQHLSYARSTIIEFKGEILSCTQPNHNPTLLVFRRLNGY
jgi:hypothetical protein